MQIKEMEKSEEKSLQTFYSALTWKKSEEERRRKKKKKRAILKKKIAYK